MVGAKFWVRAVYKFMPPALGASGAVNALVVFSVLLQPYATVLIYGILPLPAFAFGGLWLFYDLRGLFTQVNCCVAVSVQCMCPLLATPVRSDKEFAHLCNLNNPLSMTSKRLAALSLCYLDVQVSPVPMYAESYASMAQVSMHTM